VPIPVLPPWTLQVVAAVETPAPPRPPLHTDEYVIDQPPYEMLIHGEGKKKAKQKRKSKRPSWRR
jgi:hypothetical protein